MNLFLDCEFTGFRGARLLSAGLVSATGREFYLEVTNPAAHAAASQFVKDVVIPQFGLHPAALAATAVQAGHLLADFIESFNEPVTLWSDFLGDLQLVYSAMHAAGRLRALKPVVRGELAHHLLSEERTHLWDEAFRRLEDESGLVRHHALLDARVLRDVYNTVAAPRKP